MSTKKRFYIEKNPELKNSHCLYDSKSPVPNYGVVWEEDHGFTYLEELVDLLNKGWEATEELPVDVAELRDQRENRK